MVRSPPYGVLTSLQCAHLPIVCSPPYSVLTSLQCAHLRTDSMLTCLMNPDPTCSSFLRNMSFSACSLRDKAFHSSSAMSVTALVLIAHFVYVCVCVCVCVRVRGCACISACMQQCIWNVFVCVSGMSVHACICVCACGCVHMYLCLCVPICMCICMNMCSNVCMYVCAHVCKCVHKLCVVKHPSDFSIFQTLISLDKQGITHNLINECQNVLHI